MGYNAGQLATIDLHKDQLKVKFSDMTNDQIALEISSKYGSELIDFIDEKIHDDGVYEYFILGNNAHYRNAIDSLLDYIDYSDYIKWIESMWLESDTGI